MSEESVIKIIRDCNSIVNKIYCKKRQNDEYDFLKANMGVLKFIFLVILVGFIVLAISDSVRDLSWVFYLGIFTLSFGGLLVVIIASLLIFQERKHINLLGEMC